MKFDLTSRLQEDLDGLLVYPDGGDAVVLVGEEPLQCSYNVHSVILRARSPYFRTAFSPTRAKRNEENKMMLVNSKVCPAIFEIVLRYLYSGRVTFDAGTTDLAALLQAADEMMLPVLVKHLQTQLEDKVITQQLPKLLRVTAQMESCRKLHQRCQSFASSLPRKMFGPGQIEQMDAGTLQSMLTREDLEIDEIDLWIGVLRWGFSNTPGLPSSQSRWSTEDWQRLRLTLQLMVPLIRWCGISYDDFHDKVMPYRKLLSEPFYKVLTTYYLEPAACPPPTSLLPRREQPAISSVLVNVRQALWLSLRIQEAHPAIDENPLRFTRLLRGSEDGFSADTFHAHCDNMGPTILVARIADSEEIVGGYNPLSWRYPDGHDSGTFAKTDKSFVFSFSGRSAVQGTFAKVVRPEVAIYLTAYGPRFGYVDLIFGYSGNSYNNPRSCSSDQYAYNIPVRTTSNDFHVDEYEVFRVIR